MHKQHNHFSNVCPSVSSSSEARHLRANTSDNLISHPGPIFTFTIVTLAQLTEQFESTKKGGSMIFLLTPHG